MRKNQDVAMKILEHHNDVFADICNVIIFEGRQVVNPDDLVDASTYSFYSVDGKPHNQLRDVAKYWKKEETILNIARLGIENQSYIDFDMPFRMISYDGAAYREQMDKSKKRYPVASIVLYTGEKDWVTPHCLYDSLHVSDDLKPFVSDYKINVFQLAKVTKEQVGKFKSVFQNLADYMYHKTNDLDYRGSSKPLDHPDDFILAMEEITGDKRIGAVYNEITDEDNKEVNMCTLLDRVEERRSIANAKTMLEDGKLSNEDIARYSGLSLEKIKELEKEIKIPVKR